MKVELNRILELHKKWINREEGGVSADLIGADLRDADLRLCIGNSKEVKSLQIGTYLISYIKDIVNIGCKSHTLEQWKRFTDEEINKMDTDALAWWKLNKHIIIELVEREK